MYEASFTPEMAGLYGLNILLGGYPVRGCPLRLKVLADETLAKNCRCFGSGMSQAVAGAPTSFTIQVILLASGALRLPSIVCVFFVVVRGFCANRFR